MRNDRMAQAIVADEYVLDEYSVALTRVGEIELESLADDAPSDDGRGFLEAARAAEIDGDLDTAMRLCRRASSDGDEKIGIMLGCGDIARKAGQYEAARFHYEAALEEAPLHPDALLGLAVTLVELGRPDRAQMYLLRCCGVAPEAPVVWEVLGEALTATGDFAAAESAFAEAAKLSPQSTPLALRRSIAAVRNGAAEAEIERLRVRVHHEPLDVNSWVALGMVSIEIGRLDEAADALEIAVTIAPSLTEAANARAFALVRLNRMPQALAAIEHALKLSPDDLDLANNRAAALVRLNRHLEARDALRSLISKHGELPGLMSNLSNSLVSLGDQDGGRAAARRLIEVLPGAPIGWRALCNALPYCSDVDGAMLLDAYREAGLVLPRSSVTARPVKVNRAKRLRVGLLSNALKTHPVGWLTLAGFEALPTDAFELVCIGMKYPDDHMHRSFEAISAQWADVSRMPAGAVISHIAGLDLDVLIDLGGYGDQGMLPLCANRLAPVQIKWVGSQNHSTGLAEMDWFIGDRWEIPEHLERYYSERILRLPDGYVCYRPPDYAPEVAALPWSARGFLTFGCFNNLAKITPAVIRSWARIMADVGGSRLILKCHQLNRPETALPLQAEFAALGIDPDRIECRGSSSHRELLRQYADVDIVLDPFPYSGGLTTCEALWMGVPTITMPGETFASRHSTSHLSNVGLDDWIADGPEAYHDLAVARSKDAQALAALRMRLRARVAASPLCDAARFGRHLAAALHAAWTETCGVGS